MADAGTSFWKSFGPGVLFAGAAIGTSHLVQSTRAGAMFGLGLVAVVVLANVSKYAAYRFGPQYAAATGRSLIEGYRDLGRWVVWTYMIGEIAVFSIIIAATGIVTAGILTAVTGLSFDPRQTGCVLIVLAAGLLVLGGYRLLDGLTKVFVAILTLATLAATVLSLPRIDWSWTAWALPQFDLATFGFAIALMGFMPAAMDLSVLQSLWSVAKTQSTGQRPTMRNAMADFNFGYVASAVLALCFLLMGAGVMHEAGVVPETSAGGFSAQVIGLYTTNLGQWAGKVVGVAAFFVMFTTLITILDGMPRLVATSVLVLRERGPRQIGNQRSPLLYGWMVALALAAIVILLFLMNNFQRFIDFVTVTAFVVAPITALLNHQVMFSEQVPAQHRPGRVLWVWSLLGLVFLSVLSLAFIYARFMAA